MTPMKTGKAFFALCLFIAVWAMVVFNCGRLLPPDLASIEAARMQEAAMAAVRSERLERGIPIDTTNDVNGTGLIGAALSGLTSTDGSLPAKRSAATPDAAALLVRLLREAGTHPGSRVAINASGSFPGFALAAVAACGALSLDADIVLSIGSSSWGANLEAFTVVDMVDAAIDRGAFPPEYADSLVAVTPGGSDDRGLDLDPVALEAALARASARGIRVIRPASLDKAVALRMAVYSAGGEPDLLLTIGGNYASTGANPELALLSGLIAPSQKLPRGANGLVQEFIAAGKPVIQVLNIRELCARYGMPFDPRPLQPIGRAPVYHEAKPPAALVMIPPLAALALYAAFRKKNAARS
ncbi:MAG: poly-gamma-glutamate system protein [Spirochaetes bacterium]|nr:poly-gamma-glutamate system protein [Spirochaetota bacterium]